MIPGEVTGGAGAVVYIIDTSNGLLGAMTYDDSTKQLNTMPPLDLVRACSSRAAGSRHASGRRAARGSRSVI